MLSIVNILAVLGVTAAGTFAAIGPSTDLYVGNKNISPNGYNRFAVLAGGSTGSLQFPGPLITGQKGDTFGINVIDQLTDMSMLTSTSIHWHGFFQKGSSWADGPVGVTQCPIAPGHSFLYQFSAPDQAGTYWYHSHHETQYCDGLRGPFVVYDPQDPHKSKYEVDDNSTVITLADWYATPAPSAGNFPVPNATLINGLGRTYQGKASPLAVINVEQSTRYRFRLVSMSCDPNYNFTIDGHTMTIIEVDGVNVQPLEVDSIQIFAGQRYSFVLNANQLVGNYWIRANPNLGHAGFENGTNSAILRYKGASEEEPNSNTSAPISIKPLLETSLHPLDVGTGAPGVHQRGAADVNIELNITFVAAQSRFWLSNGTYNGSFTPPSLPVLLQILSKKYTPQELLPAGDVYELPPNKVIEITMPGGSAGSPHPIHLHGHNFHVIRSAGSDVDNYDDPVIRDVVSIGSRKNDNVTIRFETDNSGPWIMHCHIDWHLQMGLAVVFAENIPGIEASTPPPKKGSYSPYSKFPVGAAFTTPEGTIIRDANIENASYGGTICAERTAIVKAASEAIRSFIGLAVATNIGSAISPCGICRQVIREFCSLDIHILLVPGDYPQPLVPGAEQKPGYTEGGVKETTLGELLPDSFGPEHLDLPRK